MPLPPIPDAPPPPTPFPFGGGEEPSERFDRQIDTIKSPDSAPSAGGDGGTPPPFDVTFDTSGDPRDTFVRPGTINGVLPSNYDDVFSLAASGVYYLVLNVTASDGEIASATLSFDSSPPAGVPTLQGQPPTAFAYLLGVVVDLVWFRVIGPGSLAAAGTEVFRVSKSAPSPGTLPYDIYYTWTITAV
jgi:hypothetical protein